MKASCCSVYWTAEDFVEHTPGLSFPRFRSRIPPARSTLVVCLLAGWLAPYLSISLTLAGARRLLSTLAHMADASPPMFDIVVAATRAGGIGLRGALPWHLPSDMAFFRSITSTSTSANGM